MRPAEARWIAAQLAALGPAAVSPLVNVGSSTAEFRERRQPHIDALVFAPLRAAGVEVVHADLKPAPGVDVVGDLTTAPVQEVLRARRPRAALCSNLLEHLRDPAGFARAVQAIVPPGGHLVVTVPRSYPFHADPIDTGFRPTPDELAALFPGCTKVRGEVVADVSYGEELRALGLVGGARKAVRGAIGALRPLGDAGRAQRDRLRWLARPFTTSCVVLRVAA